MSPVNLDNAGHQISAEQVELPLETRGAVPRPQRSGEAASAIPGPDSSGLRDPRLMERIVEGGNLASALQRVRAIRAVRGWMAGR